jgi:hypothetical protein
MEYAAVVDQRGVSGFGQGKTAEQTGVGGMDRRVDDSVSRMATP